MGVEPKTRTLKLKNITVDAAIQPRAAGLDEATVEEYAAAMTAGGAFPPCRVFRSPSNTLWLSRGFHRYAGAERAGLAELVCEVIPGDRKDAIIDAACSNTDHGLKRTNADKRKAVEILLRECPEWSDNRLADAAGVGNKFVGDVRRQVCSEQTSERVGKDGKAYPVKPKADPKPAPKAVPTPDEATASGPDDEPLPTEEELRTDPLGQLLTAALAGDTEQAGGGVEEGADPQPAPPPPAGQPADPAAEFVGRINKLCHAIDVAKKEAADIAAVPVFGRHLHVESITGQLQAARSALHQSRPTEPCNCVADGKEPTPTCKACFGSGKCPASRVLKKGGR